MKIILFTHLYPSTLNGGTTSRAIHNFAKYWNESVELMVIKPSYIGRQNAVDWLKKPYLGRKYSIDGVAVLEIPFISRALIGNLFLYPLMIYLKLSNFGADCVVSHLGVSVKWGRILSNILRARFVCGIHGSDVIRRKKFIEQAAEAAILVAFRSLSIERIYNDIYGSIAAEKRFIANSGIRQELIKYRNQKQMPGRPIIITVAQLIKLKKIDKNLEALALLENRNWEYWIIGDGPERSKLELIAKNAGIEDNVVFWGKIDHKAVFEILDKASLFIMISAPETLGLAYLEAMARGCIVIGARGWGIDGIVIDGVNGFLCEPDNVTEISKKIETCLGLNAARMTTMLDEAYGTIEKYKEENVAMQYLAEIKSSIHRGKR